MTDFEAVQNLRKQIEVDLGPVDILINNAGLMPLLSLREGSEKEIQRIVDVNVTSNYYVCFRENPLQISDDDNNSEKIDRNNSRLHEHFYRA